MVGVSRLLVAFAVAGLLSQPLYADVIPTRRAADTKDSSQKVESRLVQLGLDADAAKEQVKSLTDDQTKYFAADSSDSSAKVQARLVELGLTADAAKDQVQKLNVEQTKYFAANTDRIQLVGQENWGGQSDNLWWEWVFGILALAAVGAVILIAIDE